MKLGTQMDHVPERRGVQYMYDETGQLVLDEDGRPRQAVPLTNETPEEERLRVLGVRKEVSEDGEERLIPVQSGHPQHEPPRDPVDEEEEQHSEDDEDADPDAEQETDTEATGSQRRRPRHRR